MIQSLDKVAAPTLVLVGANDTGFLAATDYMAAKIKGATKVVVPDAGHAANLHQPALSIRRSRRSSPGCRRRRMYHMLLSPEGERLGGGMGARRCARLAPRRGRG